MRQDSNHKYNNFYNSKMDNEDTKENSTENFTQEDIKELRLLDIQKCAQIISIYADILGYISILESIELVYSKYRNEVDPTTLPNPDIPILEAVNLGIISRSIFTEVGFIRYNDLYQKYINGEITYSLKPNVDINIGNVLGLASSYYILRGLKAISKRNIEQPIIGV
ncbi:hypothetical protein [Clostridium taeniosporum]|uniref:Uncharacterized protein n=1 Tax=Clostridium taeniosporum TaxID=394958 RepID=A0A1D7XK17_9CLOT|nr:hypothetical protein [Clostridium taeniosporum]AOR23683.1 hypothetical protein BGI42_08035 [Clostridium taeniosporum]